MPSVSYLLLSFFINGGILETPKTRQLMPLFLVVYQILVNPVSQVLKTPPTLVIVEEEIKLVMTRKFPLCCLVFRALAGSTQGSGCRWWWWWVAINSLTQPELQ